MGAGSPPLTVHAERVPAARGFDAAAAAAARLSARRRAVGSDSPGDRSGRLDRPGVPPAVPGAPDHAAGFALPAAPSDQVTRRCGPTTSTSLPGEADRMAELAGWMAGCTSEVPPRVREHVFVAAGSGGALPTVGHVARAVDEGRDRAAVAAREGGTLLVVAGAGEPAATRRVREWLIGETVEPAVRGPLGALWRLGDEELAILCGVALGAGEHGLALLCSGAAGTAAAGLAVAVQPGLRSRVRSAGCFSDPIRLALPAILQPGEGEGEGEGVDEAVAMLRRAC